MKKKSVQVSRVVKLMSEMYFFSQNFLVEVFTDCKNYELLLFAIKKKKINVAQV